MSDDAQAALAAALHIEDCHGVYPLEDDCNCEHRAVIILAAMPNWRLVPAHPDTFSYEGALQDAEAEIDRLRAAGEALHDALWGIDLEDGNARARTAMDGWRALAPVPSEP